jgi:hypothetical protein
MQTNPFEMTPSRRTHVLSSGVFSFQGRDSFCLNIFSDCFFECTLSRTHDSDQLRSPHHWAAPITDCVLFRLHNAYENNLQQSKVINIKVVGLCAPSGYTL